MIVDRRLLAAIALAAVVLVVGLGTVAGRTSRGAMSTPTVQATPISPVAVSSTSVDSLPVDRPVSRVMPTVAAGAAPAAVSTLPPDADIDELVRARRPLPHPATMHVDDDGHVDEQASSVAASTTVAMWSWRFDDTPTRLADTLTAVAAPEVIAELAPPPAELDRRRLAGEVAWALVTAGPVRTDPDVPGDVVVDVHGLQHVTTATTPEIVVARTASLRLRAFADGWQVIDVVQS